MALTDPAEQEILRYLFGRVSFNPPPIWYIGLSTTPINDDFTGVTEPSGGNYARVGVSNDTNSWTFSAGQITNGTIIQFPIPSASWGDISYFFMADTATASGTPRLRGSISPSQTIEANAQPKFDTGTLAIQLD